MRGTRINKSMLWAAALLAPVVGAGDAAACAVCFTGEGTPMTAAVNWMIWVMLIPLACVLTGIVAGAIHLYRKSKAPLPEHELLRRAMLEEELVHHD